MNNDLKKLMALFLFKSVFHWNCASNPPPFSFSLSLSLSPLSHLFLSLSLSLSLFLYLSIYWKGSLGVTLD